MMAGLLNLFDLCGICIMIYKATILRYRCCGLPVSYQFLSVQQSDICTSTCLGMEG